MYFLKLLVASVCLLETALSLAIVLAAGRSKALGIGLLSGGYGEAELIQAGAYRVYENPADLLEHIAEIGIEPQ
jgi:hypothetical protein